MINLKTTAHSRIFLIVSNACCYYNFPQLSIDDNLTGHALTIYEKYFAKYGDENH